MWKGEKHMQFSRGPLILRIHSEKRRKGQEGRSISGLPLSSGAQTNRRSKIEFIFRTLPNQVPIPGNRCGKAKSTCNLVAGLAMWSGPIEFKFICHSSSHAAGVAARGKNPASFRLCACQSSGRRGGHLGVVPDGAPFFPRI